MNILRKFNLNKIIKRNIVTDFKNLVELQEKSCLKHYNRPLFGKNLSNINWTTYEDWEKDIKMFRTFLHNINVNKGDKVAIIGNNKIEWAVSAYATYSLGSIFVPMYQTQREIDWKYILKDSSSKVLICTDKNVYNKCKNYIYELKDLKNIVYLDNNYNDLYSNLKLSDVPKIKNIFEEKDSFNPDENDIATIIYTSGTTGNPKGVELTHGNIVDNIKGIQKSFPDFEKISNEKDRSISFLPWAHCYGQTCELHGMISTGASMYLSEGVDKLVEEINIVKPTLLFSVPTLFNRIYDVIHKNISENRIKKILFDDAIKTSRNVRNNKKVSKLNELKHKIYDKILFTKIREKLGGNLKHSFVGGAATPFEVIEFFENINIPIIEGYGLTETSPIITLGTLDYPTRKLGSVGKALPNNDIIIKSENSIVSNGLEGEILASGPNIMKGYHNIDDSDVFYKYDGKRYFRTGDLGYLDSDDRLFITGRIKEQYKLENGKFVVPTLIEKELILSPFIKQIIVYGENRPFNIALIVPEIENLDDKKDLNNFYSEEINIISKKKNIKNYEIPKKFIILDEEFSLENGLLTPKMSVKRNKVIEKYLQEIDDIYLN